MRIPRRVEEASPARLVTWGARAAVVGGSLSVLVGVLVLVNPGYYTFESPPDLLVPVAEAVALLAILAGLAGLHLSQKEVYGRLGRAGYLMSSVGLAMAGAGHLIGLPFFVFVNTGGMAYVLIGLLQSIPLVWGTIYILGALILSVGLGLLGAATLKARTLPFWCGPVLIAGLVALWTLGNFGGWVSFGLAWIAVGQALRTVSRPARVV